MRRARRTAWSGSATDGRSTANSSPPSRATSASSPAEVRRRTATSTSSTSPFWCPRVSLTSLNPSRSMIMTATPGLSPTLSASSASTSRRCTCTRLGRPVRASCRASWRSWSMSWPFCSASDAWLATVSSSCTSAGRKVRTAPSRSATVIVPTMPASPLRGDTTASRTPSPSRYARPAGSLLPRGRSAELPCCTTRATTVPRRAWSAASVRVRRSPLVSATRTVAPPAETNATSACSARNSSLASARTLRRTSSSSGWLLTAWLKRYSRSRERCRSLREA